MTQARVPVQFEQKDSLMDVFLNILEFLKNLLFFFQEKVDDERSDKDETDESEEEEEDEEDKKNTKKNGPVQNGHTVHNNNHSKTE